MQLLRWNWGLWLVRETTRKRYANNWLQPTTSRTALVQYAHKHPTLVKLLLVEISIMIAVFVGTYLAKSAETTQSLLAAADCPTASSDAGSYSLTTQSAAYGVNMEILTPDIASPSGYNYSYALVTAYWHSCDVPAQSAQLILAPLDDDELPYYGNFSSCVPSSSLDTVQDEALQIFRQYSVSVNIGGTDAGVDEFGESLNCFILDYDITYGPGKLDLNGYLPNGGIQIMPPVQVYGTGNVGQLVGLISLFNNVVTYGSLSGVMVTVATSANDVVKSNIITCTQPTSTLTSLGTALSYTLTVYSIFKMFHYVHQFYVHAKI